MASDGDNTYKLAHMGKNKLKRKGTTVLNIVCDGDLVDKCRKMVKLTDDSVIP